MNTDWQDFLRNNGVRFDNGSIQSYPVLSQPSHQQSFACVLENHSTLTAYGPDTQKFLQGQLTCNVKNLQVDTHISGAACTPKGRVYSNFRMFFTRRDLCFFLMHKASIEPTLQHLEKYAVFFKTTLSVATPSMIGIGLMGSHIIDTLTQCFGHDALIDHHQISRIKDSYLLQVDQSNTPRFELWIPEPSFPDFWNQITAVCTPVLQDQWKLQDIRSVTHWVTPDTAEKYIPQDLNLPSQGFVSFKKGCYTGQEIVTRVQSLGTPKSRTYALSIKTNTPPEVGQALYDDNKKRVGEIIDSVIQSEGLCQALAVIRTKAAQSNPLHFNEPSETDITVHPIPYDIDPKAELKS